MITGNSPPPYYENTLLETKNSRYATRLCLFYDLHAILHMYWLAFQNSLPPLKIGRMRGTTRVGGKYTIYLLFMLHIHQ